jgi:two-component system, chemotaxis family, response regulator Rcp1
MWYNRREERGLHLRSDGLKTSGSAIMNRTAVGRPMEILLVEDNLEDARVTIQALKREDVRCRVSLVRDGEEAMTFLRREGMFAKAPRPDLILLDMELPKKDGRQVLTEIRADEVLQGVPVVVLTASRVHRTVLQADKLHVDAFMTKPVSWQQFIEAVKSLRRSWLAEIVLPSSD